MFFCDLCVFDLFLRWCWYISEIAWFFFWTYWHHWASCLRLWSCRMDTVFLAGKYGRGGPRRAHTRIIFIGHYLLNIAPFPFRFRPASVTLPFRFHPRPFRFRSASVPPSTASIRFRSASTPLPFCFRLASVQIPVHFSAFSPYWFKLYTPLISLSLPLSSCLLSRRPLNDWVCG